MEGLRHNYLNNMFDPYVAIYDAQGTMLTESDDAPLVQQDCVCGIVARLRDDTSSKFETLVTVEAASRLIAFTSEILHVRLRSIQAVVAPARI